MNLRILQAGPAFRLGTAVWKGGLSFGYTALAVVGFMFCMHPVIQERINTICTNKTREADSGLDPQRLEQVCVNLCGRKRASVR
jgi:hypothetical protein